VRILTALFFIETDDIATVLYPDLFDREPHTCVELIAARSLPGRRQRDSEFGLA
jgi:hypothetical protein